jgi:hypothetical protein
MIGRSAGCVRLARIPTLTARGTFTSQIMRLRSDLGKQREMIENVKIGDTSKPFVRWPVLADMYLWSIRAP